MTPNFFRVLSVLDNFLYLYVIITIAARVFMAYILLYKSFRKPCKVLLLEYGGLLDVGLH